MAEVNCIGLQADYNFMSVSFSCRDKLNVTEGEDTEETHIAARRNERGTSVNLVCCAFSLQTGLN